jgi:hypothetical protein
MTNNIFLTIVFISQMLFTQNIKRSELVLPESQKQKLLQMSNDLSNKYFESYNKAISKFPSTVTLKNGRIAFLDGLDELGMPLYYTVDNFGSTITSRANHLFDGGSLGLNLTGNGITAGVWEVNGYIRGSHEALVGRVNVLNGAFTESDEFTSHATHVTGTIIANGIDNSNARGYAINATVNGYDSANMYSEMASEAAQGLLVSNHSYGALPINPETGDVIYGVYGYGKYGSSAKQIDNILYLADYYLPVISAGNEGDNAPSRYDLLYGNKTSKNALIVAAVKSVSNYTGPESVEMTDFSSWGPTDDGRIKPDISNKGRSVYSSDSDSDSDYDSKSGTSMSAPGTTGAIVLLQEHNYNVNSSYLKSASMRGLLIHTADECDTNFFGADGPDYKYGWGLINAKEAATCITENGITSLIYEGNLAQGESFQLSFQAIEGEDLTATLAWTDPDGKVYNSTAENMLNYREPVLVNDLDLRISDTEGQYFPWKLDPENPSNTATTGDNIVDNVEKIEVYNASGGYDFVINHKGLLTGFSQDFTLIISGIDSSTFSVNENSLNSLNVWPNPTKDIINFKLPTQTSKPTYVSLYDVQGRQVYKETINSNNAVTRGQIKTSSLARGVYILKINQGNASMQQKVVLK